MAWAKKGYPSKEATAMHLRNLAKKDHHEISAVVRERAARSPASPSPNLSVGSYIFWWLRKGSWPKKSRRSRSGPKLAYRGLIRIFPNAHQILIREALFFLMVQPYPTPSRAWPRPWPLFFPASKKKFFFLSGPAPPPLILVAVPLMKYLFCGFP